MYSWLLCCWLAAKADADDDGGERDEVEIEPLITVDAALDDDNGTIDDCVELICHKGDSCDK